MLLNPLPPEFPRRFHPQTRVWVHLIEVLERVRQLCQHGACIAEVHPADVVAFERVDEALGHAVLIGPELLAVRRLAHP